MLKVLNYNNVDAAPSFIQEIEELSQKAQFLLFEKEFFVGACFSCAKLTTEVGPLQRCAGCQLVSYCSRKCQKEDWKIHKVICKLFPVKNGENVIVRKTKLIDKNKDIRNGSQEFLNVMTSLMVVAFWEVIKEDPSQEGNVTPHELPIPRASAMAGRLFLHARVCHVCREARPEMLFDCRCCAASYCSTAHLTQDVRHWSEECNIYYRCAMANWYLTEHHQLQFPDGLLNEANLNEGLKFEKVFKLAKYSSEKWLQAIVDLVNECLSFPMTIYYALKNLKLGEQRKVLSEITSLTIHIVHEKPMCDPRMWEFFLHQLPNLESLNLTFINGRMRLDNKYNSCLPIERCSDCKKKQRVITYNIQPMHYHEYFSCDDYVEPDVVTVFGITQILKIVRNTDNANNFTSQRNMTYSKHTVVIMTAFEEHELKAGVKSFQDARPVRILLPVQVNPGCGFSTMRALDYIYNTNYHVCCIEGKH